MRIHDLKFEEIDRDRFEEVKSGKKKVETRAANEKYEMIEEGDEICFTCGSDSISKKVHKVYRWPTVEAMLVEIPIEAVMPGLVTLEQAKQRYATYPGYSQKIAEQGILGFKLV